MRRSIQAAKRCRQIENFELSVLIDGPGQAATGLDQNQVESVVENAVGDYTITLKEKAAKDLVVVGLVSLTAQRALSVASVDEQTVNILATDLAGVAANTQFSLVLNWLGSKHNF